MTTAEYVYVAVEMLHSSATGDFGWRRNDTLDQVAKLAYDAVLVLQPLSFPDQALRYHKRSRISQALRDLERISKFVNTTPVEFIIGNYIAIDIFLQVVNSTLLSDSNFNWKDGRLLVENFLNRTFRSNLDTDEFFDASGQHQIDLAVTFYNSTTASRQVFLSLPAQAQAFQSTPNPWMREGLPPANEPFCGFEGNSHRCQISRGYGMQLQIPIGLSVATVFVMVCAVITYTSYRLFHKHPRTASGLNWWSLDGHLLGSNFVEISGRRQSEPRLHMTNFQSPAFQY